MAIGQQVLGRDAELGADLLDRFLLRFAGDLDIGAMAGAARLDFERRQFAGPVFDIDGQGRAAFALKPRTGRHKAEIGDALDHDRGPQPGRRQRIEPDPGRDRGQFLDRDDGQLAHIADRGVARIKRRDPRTGRPRQPGMAFALGAGEGQRQLLDRVRHQGAGPVRNPPKPSHAGGVGDRFKRSHRRSA
jgi:hypothetical protein